MELGFLEGTLEIVQYDHVLLLSDFNTDLRYISGFSGRLGSFLLEHSFSAVGLRDSNASCMNTWHNYCFSWESWIDYVCVSQCIQELVESFIVREGGNVSSDHWAIMTSMNIVVQTGSNEKSHGLVSK